MDMGRKPERAALSKGPAADLAPAAASTAHTIARWWNSLPLADREALDLGVPAGKKFGQLRGRELVAVVRGFAVAGQREAAAARGRDRLAAW